MSEAILVAAITGVFAVLGNMVISRQSSRESAARMERNQAVTDTKLEELTREVRAHNGFAEKIPVLNQLLDRVERDIADLRRMMGGGTRA